MDVVDSDGWNTGRGGMLLMFLYGAFHDSYYRRKIGSVPQNNNFKIQTRYVDFYVSLYTWE